VVSRDATPACTTLPAATPRASASRTKDPEDTAADRMNTRNTRLEDLLEGFRCDVMMCFNRPKPGLDAMLTLFRSTGYDLEKPA
jgi:hypothetical protein